MGKKNTAVIYISITPNLLHRTCLFYLLESYTSHTICNNAHVPRKIIINFVKTWDSLELKFN